jgi:uncharacterized damage-inducible protein DinB
VAHLVPLAIIDGLSADDAERRVDRVLHSVAELVAHLAFWQDWFCDRCEGRAIPPASTAAAGWRAVPAGTWPDVRARFAAGLDRAVALGAQADRPVAPAIEFPPLAHYTVADALVHVAQHNSHHLGQIVLLRQQLDRWPPPAGSWTWCRRAADHLREGFRRVDWGPDVVSDKQSDRVHRLRQAIRSRSSSPEAASLANGS